MKETLVLNHVAKTLDQKEVIRDATFTFEKGKIYGLLGRNGAGKTTLFNCIAKNLVLDGGKISLGDANGGNQEDYAETEIGFVYATSHLPGFMTGFEFVRFFIDMNQAHMEDIHSPQHYLELVGIKEEDQHRLIKDYSHGMQNKVQMIVTMLAEHPVILLDEPLTSFDVVAAHEMKELILKLKTNSIIIFSTHILQLAQDMCDEILLLHQGVLTEIPAADIRTSQFEEEVVRLLSIEDEQAEAAQPFESVLLKGVGKADDDT